MAASTWSTTDKDAALTLSGANLIVTQTQNVTASGVRGKDPKRTGKPYFEATSTWTDTGTRVGLAMGGIAVGSVNAAPYGSVYVRKDGIIFVNGATTGLSIGALVSGNIVGIAVDLDALLIWFRPAPAGNWNGSATANPATGVGGISIASAGLGQGFDAYPYGQATNVISDAITANFGGGAFSGTVPTGFTSGWDDTVSAVLNAVTSQTVVEEWASVSSVTALVFLNAGTTTWTVPSDWQASGATIEAVGPGGAGAAGAVTPLGGGGGQGGGYGKVTSPANINIGDVLTVQIGAAGSTNASFLRNNTSTIIAQGDYGASAVGTASGNRAQTNIGTAATRTGAAGGGTATIGGSGGGGSGGPNGNGAAGGRQTGANAGGGGGGAASGGSVGNDTAATSGANGGNNSNGAGAGAGALVTTNPGTAGTPISPFGGAGGGGGGGGGTGGAGGGAGAIGEEWDATHGTGGGGGGGGGRGNTNPGSAGGAAGTYGGGGGGGGGSTATPGTGGAGGDGLLVITYTRAGSIVAGSAQARVVLMA